MVTLSTRAQPLAATMASSSANPGLTPGTEHRRAALLARLFDPVAAGARLCPVMNDADDTTFTPADRMRTSSSTSIHIGL